MVYSSVTQIIQGDTSVAVSDSGSNGTITFTTDNSERMRVTSAGNVGIGTSSPGQKLDVQMSSSSGSSFPVMSVSNTLATQGNNTSTYNYARVDIKSKRNRTWRYRNRYDTTFSGMYLGTETNHGMFFQTLGTERMRINSDGTIKTSSTISVGAATPSTSGAGITFPATQSASTNANTLDDYEEGLGRQQ